MSNKLEFNTRHGDDDLEEGIFDFTSPLEEELDNLLDELGSERADNTFTDPEARQKLMDICGRMVSREPAFLDAYTA